MQTYADTVVNSLKICALGVLIDPNSTLVLYKALFLHNFDKNSPLCALLWYGPVKGYVKCALLLEPMIGKRIKQCWPSW